MKIGVDIDDVLAQWNFGLFNYINNLYNRSFLIKDLTSYDYTQAFPNETLDFFALCHEFYESDDFTKLLPVEDSQEGMNKLALNNSLFVITSRPENVKERTLNWLATYYPDAFSNIIFTNQFTKNPELKAVLKSQICVDLGIELMIDDAVHHAEDISAQEIPVLLLEKPWNKNYKPLSPKIVRVKSWKVIQEKVKSLNSQVD